MRPSARVHAAYIATAASLCYVVACAHNAPPGAAVKVEAPAEPGQLVGDFAIVNVTVIDVAAGVATPDLTVVVADGRIAAVGPTATTRLRAGVPTTDGAGKFLIPGLWDMHAHASDAKSWPVFLRHGVTGVRHMFSLTHGISELKADPARGAVRPRVVAASHMLDGERSRIPFPFSTRVFKADTAPAARARVRELKAAGNAFVKVQSRLPPEAYFAAVAEAKAVGLPVAGHLPYDVSAAQASDAGQHTLEHLEGVAAMCSPLEQRCLARLRGYASGEVTDPHTPWRVELEALEHFDPKIAAAGLQKFAANGTWNVPTLVQARGFARVADRDAVPAEAEKELPALVRFLWKREYEKNGVRLPNARRWYTWQDLHDLQRLSDGEVKLVGCLHRAGVPLLAGTDWPSPLVLAGEALHDELALFVQAGLTPAEALRTATVNPAKCLKMEQDIGAVEPGRCADLVLLGANPLADIRHTRAVEAVWVGGRRAER